MGIEIIQDTTGNPALKFVDDQTGKSLFELRQHGSVIGNIGSVTTLYDDFFGKAIDGKWDVQKGSDGGAANFAYNAAVSGTVRATTGAGAGATMAVNGVQLDQGLNWKAANGNLVFETYIKAAAITNLCLFAGFTNQLASLQMPVNGSGTANGLTYNAADCVGFLFDTTMTTANWWCTGQANSTPGTAVNSGSAPTAATYDKLRIEVDTAGTATYFLNGTTVGTVTGAVTAATALTPCIAAFRRTSASTTIDVDFILCQQTR